MSTNSCAGISLRGDARRHAETVFAVRIPLEREIEKLAMELVVYRKALIDAGIEPPNLSGADLLEMWEACRQVINAAHGCIAQLGTSKELLWSFR